MNNLAPILYQTRLQVLEKIDESNKICALKNLTVHLTLEILWMLGMLNLQAVGSSCMICDTPLPRNLIKTYCSAGALLIT